MRLARRFVPVFLALICLVALPLVGRGAEGIAYETETLPNGLTVIYAPMKTSPVVHVRVLYHVGSKDERPDRQGFAHMFEHMMFRGSEHVKPEEHMKLIQNVGGYSNAFTSFDQTVYHDTVPATEVNLPLWLEADRMASFKVSPGIFYTERLVVAEEWRLRQNQPYGTVWDELLNEAFKKHHYQWTPIGNMDHLRAARTRELQEFFNRYYVPRNAVLVIAGNIDVGAVRTEVHKDFGWLPNGAVIVRESPAEPEQTEARRRVVPMRVPLARVMVAYPMPPFKDEDQDAIGVMLTILGEGRSSRLSQALVTSKEPQCVQAESMGMGLEDGGLMGVSAVILEGKDAAEVEKEVRAQIALMSAQPVTAEELAKAKMQARLELVKRSETAENTASELGEEMLFRGDLSHVNTAQARIDALTAADILRVAKKYLVEARATTLVITPDAKAAQNLPATTVAATGPATAESQPATQAEGGVRAVMFPPEFETVPPVSAGVPSATFAKGVEKEIDGARVIVMSDRRLPEVHWSLTFGGGSYREPGDKTGLGGIVAAMVRRGPKGTTYNAFNEGLEARGITLEVSDGGDYTRISGNCLTEQLPFALGQMRAMLREPAFDAGEFGRLRAQSLSSVRLALNSPTGVADRELKAALFGASWLGRYATPGTLGAITLEDVKGFFGKDSYGRTGQAPILILAGDVTVEEGQKLAGALLAEVGEREKGELAAVPGVAASAGERRIVLIDRADARQANIRMGIRAYTIQSEEKFAGSLAGQILSYGIDSRLGKYVRAEKGLAYGVEGYFNPTRQAGTFEVSTDTKVETTVEAVEACFKVLDEMRSGPVSEKELRETQRRIAGSMLMSMQTIWQQATRRVDGILNHYPIDYYDVYPQRIAKVTAGDIQDVMKKYVDDEKMTVVVVGPAEKLKEGLGKVGTVEVLAMPLERKTAP